MRKTRTLVTMLIGVATLLAASQTPALAQTPETPPSPLTDKIVQGFADAMLDLARWSHKNSERWEEMSDRWGDEGGELSQERIEQYMGALSEYLGESSEISREVTRIVERRGFSSLDHWSEVSSRIMHTYSVVKLSETDISSPLESIAAAGLTPEQKEHMEAAMAEVKSKMGEFADSVPDADKRVVARNVELIEEAVKAASEVGAKQDQ